MRTELRLPASSTPRFTAPRSDGAPARAGLPPSLTAPSSPPSASKPPAKGQTVQTVRVDGGGDLVVTRSGNGPAALMLSGGPGIANYMDDLAHLLHDDFHSIRYTHRGVMPATQAPPYTITQHMRDALTVLDTLDIPKVWLIGHSWGGYLALRMAQEHPDRVAGVISIGGLGLVGDGGYKALRANGRARMTPEERATSDKLRQQIIWGAPPVREAAYQKAVKLWWPVYFADRETAPPYVPKAVNSWVSQIGTWNTQFELGTGYPARRLPDVKAPTLFIHGEADPLPVSASHTTAARMRNGAQVVTIPDAGHYPWMEKPDAVRGAFLNWKATLAAQEQPAA